jgi:hypothetical protein
MSVELADLLNHAPASNMGNVSLPRQSYYLPILEYAATISRGHPPQSGRLTGDSRAEKGGWKDNRKRKRIGAQNWHLPTLDRG